MLERARGLVREALTGCGRRESVCEQAEWTISEPGEKGRTVAGGRGGGRMGDGRVVGGELYTFGAQGTRENQGVYAACPSVRPQIVAEMRLQSSRNMPGKAIEMRQTTSSCVRRAIREEVILLRVSLADARGSEHFPPSVRVQVSANGLSLCLGPAHESAGGPVNSVSQGLFQSAQG